jgi:hypothetical protein
MTEDLASDILQVGDICIVGGVSIATINLGFWWIVVALEISQPSLLVPVHESVVVSEVLAY